MIDNNILVNFSGLTLPLEAIEKANHTIALFNSSTVLGQSLAADHAMQSNDPHWKRWVDTVNAQNRMLNSILSNNPLVNPALFDEYLKNWESIQGSLDSFNTINQNLFSVPPTVIQSIKNALLYMNESQREEFRLNILPQMEDLSKEKKLSCGDWLSILSILVTILFELFSQLPDPQQAQMIRQNDVIIEQQTQIIQQNDVLIEQQAEQNRLDEQFANTTQALADNIDLLCNVLQHSGDLRQGMNDVHKPESLPDPKDSQQANRDVQD